MADKGSTGAKKFQAKAGTFYVPGGSSMSCPMAKMEPFIHRDNSPHHLLTIFEKGLKSAADWGQLVREAVICDEGKRNTEEECGATKEEEDHVAAMEDGDFEESSTIMLGMDEVEYDDIEISIEPLSIAFITKEFQSIFNVPRYSHHFAFADMWEAPEEWNECTILASGPHEYLKFVRSKIKHHEGPFIHSTDMSFRSMG
jgi:hypothetical protein